MAVTQGLERQMSLKFNGISKDENSAYAHISAPAETWQQIVDILDRFQEYGVTLQDYTGISNLHAARVVEDLRQHIATGQETLVIRQGDFVAIDALINEYQNYGYSRIGEIKPDQADSRTTDLRNECGQIRLEIEAAL